MNDGFDANLDAAGRFRGIEIAEFKKESSSSFNDFLRRRISWLVHPALVTRQAQNARNPREPGGKLCSPKDFIRVAAVRGSPYVGNIERRADFFRLHFLAKQPIQQILIDGKILQPQK